MEGSEHIPHRDGSIAYHVEWGFRREALVWNGENPVRPNFFPSATYLRDWLRRKSGSLRVLLAEDMGAPGGVENPFAHHSSVLAVCYSQVINDANALASGATHVSDPIDAEIRRHRLYNELVLLAARTSESLTKQILHCTDFPPKDYKKAALGGLLDQECRGCKASKKEPHRVSLLGSLAHRYGRCHEYEQCLSVHLDLANKARNARAAHATVAEFVPDHVDAIRVRMRQQLTELGEDFVHMLQHLGQLEEDFAEELISRTSG